MSEVAVGVQGIPKRKVYLGLRKQGKNLIHCGSVACHLGCWACICGRALSYNKDSICIVEPCAADIRKAIVVGSYKNIAV